MQSHSTAEADILASDHYTIHSRLWVDTVWWTMLDLPTRHRGAGVLIGEAVDEEPFLAGTVNADLDQPVQSAEYRLNLGLAEHSLSPHMSSGPTYNGRSLLDVGMYLRHEIKVVSPSFTDAQLAAAPWRGFFAGRIDSADPAGDDDVVVVRARDVYADWLEAWIEPHDQTFDHEILEGEIGTILGDLILLLPVEARGTLSPTLWIQGTPSLLIPAYYQQPKSGLLALREAALLNGWDLRGRWGTTDNYIITYYEPDRALANVLLDIPANQIDRLRELPKDRTEVRNVVEVQAADATRSRAKVTDNTSIAAYGRKYLGIFEDEHSRIVNMQQALALAANILLDTKHPKVQAIVERRMHPFLEVNDVVMVRANGVQHDQDLTVGVSGLSHTFSEDGDVTTLLRTRARPAAASREWRERANWQREFVSTLAPAGSATEGARWSQVTP